MPGRLNVDTLDRKFNVIILMLLAISIVLFVICCLVYNKSKIIFLSV